MVFPFAQRLSHVPATTIMEIECLSDSDSGAHGAGEASGTARMSQPRAWPQLAAISNRCVKYAGVKSLHEPAAVHGEHDPGDEARVIAQQEPDRAGDVDRLAEALD